MKRLLLFIIFIGTIVSCSKVDESNAELRSEVEEKLTTNMNVLRDAAVSYGEVLQQTGDSLAAYDSMRIMLGNHPDVSDGTLHDLGYLDVEFSNGLKSSISIIDVNEDEEHLTRGGGGGTNSLTEFRFGEIAKEIKNDKVLVMIPYPNAFRYRQSQITDLKTSIESNELELKADILQNSQVDLQALNRLGDYGLIILDMHGLKHGIVLSFLDVSYNISELWFPDAVLSDVFDLQSIPPDKLANGEIEIGLTIKVYPDVSRVDFRFQVVVTEEYIRNLNIDLSNAVLFGNHCYSGHTANGPTVNNMSEAWKSKGLATYYGYAHDDQISVPVDNDFCKSMEQLLIKGLITDGEQTGEANLLENGTNPFYYKTVGYYPNDPKLMALIEPQPDDKPVYFIQFFAEDYEYESCGDEFVDSRDSIVYKTVCIGDQIWMAENLRYNAPGSYCYDNDESKCNEYGRLYPYSAMVGNILTDVSNEIPSGIRGICPEGWHIPSYAEWSILFTEVGGFSVIGDKLKSTDGWSSNGGGSDDYNFTAKPGGQSFESSVQPLTFSKITESTGFWTCSHFNHPDGYTIASSSLVAGQSSGVSYTTWADETFGYTGLSCRCVKD